MHTCEDVGQGGLAHSLLPYKHHSAVGVSRLRRDDRVCGVGGPAPSAVVLRSSRLAVSEVAGVGILLDHQMPAISRDAPALLWLHAHSALAHGDIIQSHCGILGIKAVKNAILLRMSQAQGSSTQLSPMLHLMGMNSYYEDQP